MPKKRSNTITNSFFYSVSVMLNVARVRQKVRVLVNTMAISKTKLGEILGSKKKNEDPRVRINRANRFLSGAQKNISLQQVSALADFFGKPVEWFLFDASKELILASPEKHTSKSMKPLEEIRKNLKLMGFDDAFIETQIRQLEAMEAYNLQKNNG